jgi:hypothetical protein
MAEINIKDAIKRLQSDEEYYGEFGSQFLHNSDIYTFLNNPQDYGTPKTDTVPMMFGRAFHEQVLFNNCNQEYVDASTRNTKIYKQELEDSGVDLILLKKEYEDIKLLKGKTISHVIVNEVLSSSGIKKEIPSLGQLTDSGILWACKADIITKDYVYDLKTTSSLSGFKKSARMYNYDSQAYIYSTLFQKPMRFIVAEKGTGAIGLFDTSDEAYHRGREKVLETEALYKKYFLYNEDDISNYYRYDEI